MNNLVVSDLDFFGISGVSVILLWCAIFTLSLFFFIFGINLIAKGTGATPIVLWKIIIGIFLTGFWIGGLVFMICWLRKKEKVRKQERLEERQYYVNNNSSHNGHSHQNSCSSEHNNGSSNNKCQHSHPKKHCSVQNCSH